MKVGIDISQSVYHGTGVASYTRNLVKSLLEYDQANHYILFGSTLRRQRDLQDFLSTLPHRVSLTKKIFSLPPTALEFIWNKIHAVSIENFIGNLDIFHTSDWTEPPARAPKVTTIHDLVIYKYPQFLNHRIVETQRRKLEWVKKETAAIIADSQSTKEDIKEHLKIPDEKIQVVHLGVGKEYSPQKTDVTRKVRKKYKIHGEYILSVGTREPRKNLHRIIEAYDMLSRKDLQLVIVGNIGWGNDIVIGEKVLALEDVPIVDLVGLYTGAVCFVYPSLYEGFGLPVLEAMACGVPVVTSERGSLAEISGVAAISVDPESVRSIAGGIEEALAFPYTKRKKSIEIGIEHATHFTWEKTARKTLEVYTSVI